MINWVKGFLILYLLLTVFQNMAASETYEKYLKFFSGIILLLYVITPILKFSGDEQLLSNMLQMEDVQQQLESFRRESRFFEFENQQSETALKQYEQAFSKEAVELLQLYGWPVKSVIVRLNVQYQIQKIQVFFIENERANSMEVSKILQQQYQILPEQIEFPES